MLEIIAEYNHLPSEPALPHQYLFDYLLRALGSIGCQISDDIPISMRLSIDFWAQ